MKCLASAQPNQADSRCVRLALKAAGESRSKALTNIMEDVPVTLRFRRFPPACAGVVTVIAVLFLAGCGGPISPDEHMEVVLLDTSVNLVEGVTCLVGYVGADFGGVIGRTVVISVAGAPNLTPIFTLYAPDFATLLGVSSSTAAGTASLSFTLTQTGLHHLSICDVKGTPGPLKVNVKQLK
jgi:hypothetical protein